MLAIELHFLTGRAVLTAHNDRECAEWPPHPARVFSALVAALFAGDASPAEREALRWLAALPAPAIWASDASPRAVLKYFVPTNDVSAHIKRHNLLARKADQEEWLRAELLGEADPKEIKKRNKQLEKVRTEIEDRAAMSPDNENLAVVEDADESSDDGDTEDGDPKKKKDKTPGAGLPTVPRVDKKERFWPSVTPYSDRMYLIWEMESETAPAHLDALRSVASRVTRLGHSSSMISARWVDQAPEPNWSPDPEGAHPLRVVGDGQLERLEQEHGQHQNIHGHVLPFLWQSYRKDTEETQFVSPTPLGPWTFDHAVLFERSEGPRFTAVRAVELSKQLRRVLMSFADERSAGGLGVPALLSGHADDGRPLQSPHVAIVPLPYVGSDHADGTVKGLALLFPAGASADERKRVLRAIANWERSQNTDSVPELPLHFGKAGSWHLTRYVDGPLMYTLRPSTWKGPARRWSSVTPVALSRNPGDLFSDRDDRAAAAFRNAEAVVRRECAFAGLPEPVAVQASLTSQIRAGSDTRSFPPYPPVGHQKPVGNMAFQRVLVHVDVTFPVPVSGPLLLGAGRHHGLGLFKPVQE